MGFIKIDIATGMVLGQMYKIGQDNLFLNFKNVFYFYVKHRARKNKFKASTVILSTNKLYIFLNNT